MITYRVRRMVLCRRRCLLVMTLLVNRRRSRRVVRLWNMMRMFGRMSRRNRRLILRLLLKRYFVFPMLLCTTCRFAASLFRVLPRLGMRVCRRCRRKVRKLSLLATPLGCFVTRELALVLLILLRRTFLRIVRLRVVRLTLVTFRVPIVRVRLMRFRRRKLLCRCRMLMLLRLVRARMRLRRVRVLIGRIRSRCRISRTRRSWLSSLILMRLLRLV